MVSSHEPADADTDDGAGGTPQQRHLIRRSLAAVAMALGLVCVTVSPVALWGRNLVLNTDRYVDTLAPIASDAAVQEAVVNLVSDAITQRLDVAKRVEDAMPKIGKYVAPPLAGAVGSFVHSKTAEFVASPTFAKIWASLNRRVHTQIRYLLTGDRPSGDRSVVALGTKVVLDLSGVVQSVEQQLHQVGIEIASNVPAVGPTLQIADLHGLQSARTAVHWLDVGAYALPVAGLGLLAIGIALATKRRRSLAIAAFGTSIGMVVLTIGLLIGRSYYLDGIPPSVLPHNAAADIYAILVRYLRWGVRLIFLTGVLIGLASWVTGTGDVAIKVRTRVAGGPVGAFVARRTAALRGSVAALVVALFLIVDAPSALGVVTVLTIGVVLVVVIEVLRSLARPVWS